MIRRRIPMNVLQKGVFTILSQYQTTSVYDDVPPYQMDAEGNPLLGSDDNPIPVKLPYITFGAFTCKPLKNKTVDMCDVSQQLHIWSEYEGKKEVNGIADDITAVLTSWPLVLEDDFEAIEQDIDFFEAFPEDAGGYHGVITFIARVQNKKQS